MAHVDLVYNKLVNAVLNNGFNYFDTSRDNIKMLQIPSYNLEINMLEGFPLLTTKRIYWTSIIHELIWIFSGSTNIDYLKANNVNIWNKDAANFSQGNENFVGRIYGAQLRSFIGIKELVNRDGITLQAHYIDQLHELLKGLKTDLYNRRHIVSYWNPSELNNMALPPCHWAFEILPCKIASGQLFETDGFYLKWHQRSVDTMLGLPFDIGFYAAVGKLIERETGLHFIKLIGDLSNVHFYSPHIKLVRLQMMREPSPIKTDIIISQKADIYNLSIEDFGMTNYEPHLPIKAELFTKVNKNEDSKN